MEIGSRIKHLRKQQGLSQEAFAEKLGVSRQSVSKWESGVSLPDIEKLYEDYKALGFYVIGVYSSTGMASDVEKVMKDAGITYPIATYDEAFGRFQTGYVPTTIFVDEHGWLLPIAASDSEKLFTGARSYEDWAALIETYLLYDESKDGTTV